MLLFGTGGPLDPQVFVRVGTILRCLRLEKVHEHQTSPIIPENLPIKFLTREPIISENLPFTSAFHPIYQSYLNYQFYLYVFVWGWKSSRLPGARPSRHLPSVSGT